MKWLFFLLFAVPALAQNFKPVEELPVDTCRDFGRIMHQADSLFGLGNYQLAFYKYSAAKVCNPNRYAEVDGKIQALFNDALRLRDIAAQNRDSAFARTRRDERVQGYFHFSEGRAWAYSSLDARFALIDENGQQLTEFNFTEPQRFQDGVAVAKENNQWIAVNRSGKQMGEPFDALLIAENGFVVYKGQQWFFADKNLKITSNAFDELNDQRHCFWAKKGGKWCLTDRYGDLRTPAQYQRVSNFSQGRAVAYFPDKSIVVIDTMGKELFNLGLRYQSAGQWSEGLLAVERDKIWGFVDNTGAEVIAPAFQEVLPFSQGRAAAKLNGSWGFIDTLGNWAIAPRYYIARSFVDGRAAVALSSVNAWGCIDLNGKEVVEFKFTQIASFYQGRATALSGKKWGWVDTLGKWTPINTVDALGDFNNGLAPALDKEKWGFVSLAGEWLVQPQFHALGKLDNGIAVFSAPDEKLGFVDAFGKVILRPRFFYAINGIPVQIVSANTAFAYTFEDGAAYLPFQNSHFYICPNGKMLQPKPTAQGKL